MKRSVRPPAPRRRLALALSGIALVVLTGVGTGAQEASLADRVRLLLRARFPGSGAAPRLAIDQESFRAGPALACFYERRGYAAAWSAAGALRPATGELLAALARAGDDGLATALAVKSRALRGARWCPPGARI